MTMERFKNIISMIPHRTEVRLFLSGEPFLNPNLINMIDYATNWGHIVLIHSNGTKLTKHEADELIRLSHLKPNNIAIWFTAHNKKFSNNVDYLIDKSDWRMKLTIQEIIPYPEPLKIPKYLKKYECKVPIQLRYPHNWDKKDSIENSEPQEYKGVCGFLKDSMAIYWNGDVTVCCADLNGDRIIGHIDDGWEAIENKMDAFVETWGAQRHICRGCERYAEKT